MASLNRYVYRFRAPCGEGNHEATHQGNRCITTVGETPGAAVRALPNEWELCPQVGDVPRGERARALPGEDSRERIGLKCLSSESGSRCHTGDR